MCGTCGRDPSWRTASHLVSSLSLSRTSSAHICTPITSVGTHDLSRASGSRPSLVPGISSPKRNTTIGRMGASQEPEPLTKSPYATPCSPSWMPASRTSWRWTTSSSMRVRLARSSCGLRLGTRRGTFPSSSSPRVRGQSLQAIASTTPCSSRAWTCAARRTQIGRRPSAHARSCWETSRGPAHFSSAPTSRGRPVDVCSATQPPVPFAWTLRRASRMSCPWSGERARSYERPTSVPSPLSHTINTGCLILT
mmetsp:Transcript_1011/g.4124  ORF Transcript_1011/g.4124 Transcript_1011/m.4124 type:complete len:252 (+) Transcript_1011:315-1070(+)